MARGYGMHARVLASSLGKRVAPLAEKHRARPLFLEGSWGSFERVLADAIQLSVPVIEAVWASFEAGEREANDARATLDRLLPPGSIEGQGFDVNLEHPFAVRPPAEIAL